MRQRKVILNAGLLAAAALIGDQMGQTRQKGRIGKNLSPSSRKKGPGRIHRQGWEGTVKEAGRGFKGVSFAPARPLSIFHPFARAQTQAFRELMDNQTLS